MAKRAGTGPGLDGTGAAGTAGARFVARLTAELATEFSARLWAEFWAGFTGKFSAGFAGESAAWPGAQSRARFGTYLADGSWREGSCGARGFGTERGAAFSGTRIAVGTLLTPRSLIAAGAVLLPRATRSWLRRAFAARMLFAGRVALARLAGGRSSSVRLAERRGWFSEWSVGAALPGFACGAIRS